MKVKDIIEKLEKLNPESDVYISQCSYPGEIVNDVISYNDIVEIE